MDSLAIERSKVEILFSLFLIERKLSKKEESFFSLCSLLFIRVALAAIDTQTQIMTLCVSLKLTTKGDEQVSLAQLI